MNLSSLSYGFSSLQLIRQLDEAESEAGGLRSSLHDADGAHADNARLLAEVQSMQNQLRQAEGRFEECSAQVEDDRVKLDRAETHSRQLLQRIAALTDEVCLILFPFLCGVQPNKHDRKTIPPPNECASVTTLACAGLHPVQCRLL